MKSLTWLHDLMLAEARIACCTDTHRDSVTLSRRTKHEGLSFLTITLPSFCREFERSLEFGKVAPTSFPGFRKRRALPAFLQGLLGLVFDPLDGVLLKQPSITAINMIRQFCLLMKKVELPCTPVRVRGAMDKYVSVEKELTDRFHLSDEDKTDLRLIGGAIWSRVLRETDSLLCSGSLVPKHGPGATADRIYANAKYNHIRWHTRLEPFFPFDAYGLPNPDVSTGGEYFDAVQFVEPDAEQPVRVVSVPKTLSAPRIIAIEPVCMQYTQQALAESIVESIERHPLSAGRVNFHDQRINQDLAKDSSRSGSFSTVDLSDASDRVHQDLVYLMLDSLPTLRDAIFACRSTRATLADSRTLNLTKFASMGSALCFPIESMVFFTLCALSRYRKRKALSTRLTSGWETSLLDGVYIYGDDIIVPTDEVQDVIVTLESFGLKVNSHKTFMNGKFRESCGMDAYDGIDVTPVYLRRMLPDNIKSTPEIVSSISFANQLYKRGYWILSRSVRKYIDNLIGALPTVSETSPCLGWHTFSQGYDIHGWDKQNHSWKIRGYVLKSRRDPDPLTGIGALMKFFLKRGNEPSSRNHLEYSSRSGSVSMKIRWATPY